MDEGQELISLNPFPGRFPDGQDIGTMAVRVWTIIHLRLSA
jgi:hypothetical protein